MSYDIFSEDIDTNQCDLRALKDIDAAFATITSMIDDIEVSDRDINRLVKKDIRNYLDTMQSNIKYVAEDLWIQGYECGGDATLIDLMDFNCASDEEQYEYIKKDDRYFDVIINPSDHLIKLKNFKDL